MNRSALLLLAALACAPARAQFIDEFNGPSISGWAFRTGDGAATIDFQQGDGHGSILVDATKDTRNIWWAIIQRNVGPSLDLARLKSPGQAIRVEARVRSSHAPRRINLSLNTPRTTDFHKNLMEFDIPEAGAWHVISMTDPDLRAEPGMRVNAQLALMDWGLGKYRLDVDYFKVEIVDPASAGPDKGFPVPYRPPLADPQTFRETVKVSQDSVVDQQYPGVNLNKWRVADEGAATPVLAVGGTQMTILRWDLGSYKGKKAAGSGLLELTTHSVQRADIEMRDFGAARVSEILAGDPGWDQRTVTLNSLLAGKPLDDVVNSQMIIDVEPAEGTLSEKRGGKTLVTISRPVLQRLLDGKTLGLALRPLGAVNWTLYGLEHRGGELAPRLYFTVE